MAELHQSEAMAAQSGMVDRGDGDKQVRVGPGLSSQSQLCWLHMELRLMGDLVCS